MKSELTAEKFLADVKNHALTIIKDEDEFRHIVLGKPGTSSYRFALTTWPGYLCISGDMGCFMFSRIPDMFEFFRDSKGELKINRSYWAEKVQAENRHGGVKKFSSEIFMEKVKETLDESDLSVKERKAILDEVGYDCEHNEASLAYNSIRRHGGKLFQDFYEVNCEEWDFCYEWCCYAIVWGIQQYDERKAASNG